MVKNRTYGTALNEIEALKQRNAELERENRSLHGVADDLRGAVQRLVKVLDNAQAVAS